MEVLDVTNLKKVYTKEKKRSLSIYVKSQIDFSIIIQKASEILKYSLLFGVLAEETRQNFVEECTPVYWKRSDTIDPEGMDNMELFSIPLERAEEWIEVHTEFNKAFLPYLGNCMRELEAFSESLAELIGSVGSVVSIQMQKIKEEEGIISKRGHLAVKNLETLLQKCDLFHTS